MGPVALETRLWAARARRNVHRLRQREASPEELVPGLVSGRSFADVGAMWTIHGRVAFSAEEHGATAVTAVDVSPESEEFRAEHARRGSQVRFVQGDLHDPATLDEVGPHDVVWCSGVLYHCPNPVQSLQCLRRITAQTLVLVNATIPEIGGVRQATVFFPTLPEPERRAYDRAYTAVGGPATRLALSTPFDATQGYGNWWWGLTPSAIAGMLEAAGFSVQRTTTNGFNTAIVAQAV